MKKFFSSKTFKIIAVIAAVLFGMLIYNATTGNLSNLPAHILSTIAAPFQKATAYVSSKVGDFFDTFFNAKENEVENEKLKSTIDELNKKLIDYEKMSTENEMLKKVAGIKETNQDFELVSAFVISRDPADRYGSFIIDKGTLHSINVHDPVITTSGIVGIVTEVSPISARVETILSPNISVSSYEINSKELGVLSGELLLAKENKCKFSILSEKTNIKQDDIIVSAGSTGRFPKDLPLGKVHEIGQENHGSTMYAIIKPMDDISKVTDVYVITDFLGQGSELIDYIDKE